MKEKINIAKFYFFVRCKNVKITDYNKIKYIPVYFEKKNKPTKPNIFKRLKTDVFEKRTPVSQNAEKIQAAASQEDRIKRLYDEVFDEVLLKLPIMNKINAQKPNLVFDDNLEINAAYNFTTNSLEFNSNHKDDLFAYFEYDKTKKVSYCGIYFKNSIENQINSAKVRKVKYKVIKLNQNEKELYIKSVVAHELRHWAQEHILVSTKNCQGAFEYKLGIVNEILRIITQAISAAKEDKTCENESEKWEKSLKEMTSRHSYILNYKPQIVFDENNTLDVATLSPIHKYWSVKEHFLPAFLRYNNSDKKEYETNPTEIDAYCFQADFLIEKYLNKNKYSNIRTKIFQAMALNSMEYGFLAAEKIEELGYPPLIEE